MLVPLSGLAKSDRLLGTDTPLGMIANLGVKPAPFGLAALKAATNGPPTQGESTALGMTSEGAIVTCPGLAQPTARSSPRAVVMPTSGRWPPITNWY